MESEDTDSDRASPIPEPLREDAQLEKEISWAEAHILQPGSTRKSLPDGRPGAAIPGPRVKDISAKRRSIVDLKKFKAKAIEYQKEKERTEGIDKKIRNMGAGQVNDDFWNLGNELANETIDKIVKQNPKTARLSMELNDMTHINPAVYELEMMAFLSFGRNRLNKIPPGLSRLKHCGVFFIDNNLFSSVPEEVFDLADTLTMFSICNNHLTSLPPTIGVMKNLNILYLSDNQLTEVPDQLGNAHNLKELYLHNNKLETLPSSLGNLHMLKILDISNNKLKSIPSEYRSMTELAEMYAQSNLLQELGDFTLSLRKLNMLNIKDNPLERYPKGFDVVLRHFQCVVLSDLDTDLNDPTGLHYCATVTSDPYQSVDLASRIISKSKDVNRTVNALNEHNQTALHVACLSDRPELATTLVVSGVDLDRLDDYGFLAAEYIGFKPVREFCHYHPFFNTKIGELYKERATNSTDESLLLLDAALHPGKYGRYGFPGEVVKAFIDCKEGRMKTFSKVAETLLKAKGDLRLFTRKMQIHGNTPRLLQSAVGAFQAMSPRSNSILENGEDDEALNTSRDDAGLKEMDIFIKSWLEQLSFAAELVFESPTAIMGMPETTYQVLPLHVAAVKGRAQTMTELLEAGADIKIRNKQGKTALHMASQHGQPEVLQQLIDDFERLEITRLRKEQENTREKLIMSKPRESQIIQREKSFFQRLTGSSTKSPQAAVSEEESKESIREKLIEKTQAQTKLLVNSCTNPSQHQMDDLEKTHNMATDGGASDADVDGESKHDEENGLRGNTAGKSPIYYAIEGCHIGCVNVLLNAGANVKRGCVLRYRPVTAHDTALHLLTCQRQHHHDLQGSAASAHMKRSAEQGVAAAEGQIDAMRKHPDVASERRSFAFQYFVRHISGYFWFLLLLSVVAMDSLGDKRHGDYFPLVATIDHRMDGEFDFARTPFPKTFDNISDEFDFWSFVEGPLANGLFPQRDGAGLELAPEDRLFLDGKYNRLVGSIRFRQIRARDGCSVPESFSSVIDNCYSSELSDNTDMAPFGPNNEWEWLSESELRGQKTRFSGVYLDRYPGSGHVVDLVPDPDTFLDHVGVMRDNGYIDHQTRVVFIEFVHANANVDLLVASTYMAEFPPQGGVYPTNDIRAVKLAHLDFTFSNLTTWLELLVFVIFFAYLMEEVHEAFEDGVAEYVKSFWNYIDGSANILFILVLTFRLLTIFELRDLDFDASSDKFTNFQRAIRFQDLERESMAFLMMLSYFRVLKYAEYLPGIGPFPLAVTRTITHVRVLVFIGFTVVVVFSFIIGHFLAFRVSLKEYYSFSRTALTAIKTTFGDFKVLSVDQGLEVVLFSLMMVMVVLVLLNLFIGVLSEVYQTMFGNAEVMWNKWLTDTMAAQLEEKGTTKVFDMARVKRALGFLSCGIVTKLRFRRHRDDVKTIDGPEDDIENDTTHDLGEFLEDIGLRHEPAFTESFPPISTRAVENYVTWADEMKVGSIEVNRRVGKLEKDISNLRGEVYTIHDTMSSIEDKLVKLLAK